MLIIAFAFVFGNNAVMLQTSLNIERHIAVAALAINLCIVHEGARLGAGHECIP
jgi:hypothetical protein